MLDIRRKDFSLLDILLSDYMKYIFLSFVEGGGGGDRATEAEEAVKRGDVGYGVSQKIGCFEQRVRVLFFTGRCAFFQTSP